MTLPIVVNAMITMCSVIRKLTFPNTRQGMGIEEHL